MARILRAVVFDWAGTVVDFGSLAPVGALIESFAAFGVSLTPEVARGPMGLEKRDHVAKLLADENIAQAWRARHGAAPTERDIDAVHAELVPRNRLEAAARAKLVPGAAEAAEALRREGVRLGGTTGYPHDIMDSVTALAADQGFAVDALACAGDTRLGRPSPLMVWKVLGELGVWPPSLTVKVDDTGVGIAEGLNAGAWTVGVSVSGNLFGCSEAEIAAMPQPEFARRRSRAQEALREAGAHVVIETVADLDRALVAIERHIANSAGQTPETIIIS